MLLKISHTHTHYKMLFSRFANQFDNPQNIITVIITVIKNDILLKKSLYHILVHQTNFEQKHKKVVFSLSLVSGALWCQYCVIRTAILCDKNEILTDINSNTYSDRNELSNKLFRKLWLYLIFSDASYWHQRCS